MEITVDCLKKLYHCCNVKYFNGVLKTPKFKIIYSYTYYASFIPGLISFNRNVKWTDEYLMELMVHEMIHQYIRQKRYRHLFSHGIIFRLIMCRLNKKYNLKIRVHPKIDFIKPQRKSKR